MSVLIENLQRLQADYQVFYQKLRNYHWSVKGPLFFELHRKFEELYLDSATKVDDIAERLITLGNSPLRTMADCVERAHLQEDNSSPDASGMVSNLVEDLGALTRHLRETAAMASDGGDAGTANLLEGFADEQEKTTWMLRAYLAG